MVYLVLPVVFLILAGSLRRGWDFQTTFVSLSLAFSTIFYLFPLVVINSQEGFWMNGWRPVSSLEVIQALLAFVAFFGGFFALQFLVRDMERKFGKINPTRRSEPLRIRPTFLLVVIALITYLGVRAMDPSRAAIGYAVRAGEVQGSHFVLLGSLFLGALAYGVLLLLAEAGKKKTFVCVWLLMLVYYATGATGRMTLVFLLSVGVIYLFFRKSARFVAVALIVCCLTLPIIVNMKSVIYDIAYLREFPDLAHYYSIELGKDALVSQFGHPLYSFLLRDSLVGIIGYRYFYDLIQGILFYGRVVGLDFGDSITYYNTESLLGMRESIVPPGYLAFGYVQLSWLGVFIAGALYRGLGLLSLWCMNSARVASPVATFYFAFLPANSFYHGDIRILVMTLFIPLLTVSLFLRFYIKGGSGTSDTRHG